MKLDTNRGGGGGRCCWSLGSIILTTLLITLSQVSQNVDAAAVMSVDLGSEWIKIGIVSPGVPMEIVLNKESKRKTPVAVSFRDGERLIGEDALSVAVRFPSNAYIYFLDLLGKKMDNPIVQLYQKRFPQYKLVADDERSTVLFQHDEETVYSPEELLAMILNKCREYAQDFARQPVKETVITVPPFFNQAERRSVLNAAELAGLKVLQLMNTNTAAALNYGIFRRKDFNETPQNILLYDMGASSTVATIVSYQIVKTKDKGISETNPQVSVLGVGYDRTLGGLEMQLRLRDFLAKAFNDMKKTKTDVFTNPRSMAKLFKEAGRLKNVLSANADHYAQVEGLLDEQDFKVKVTRDQFENLCEDQFSRVKGPVEQALDSAAITMDVIDQVILVGAGTRVPKVQEKLNAYVKRELGKSLNTDESAAMDAVLLPILVDFEREIDNEDGSKTIKIVRRTLFSSMNPYPQKKILTFNKHTTDFNFYVSYGDLAFSKEEVGAIGSTNITKINLSGVAAALEKNAGQTESKGVKAHFSMDDSGILSINLIESVFEKNTTDTDSGDGGVQDTLSKLGSAFTKLFSGTAEEGEQGADKSSEGGDAETANETSSEGSQQQEQQPQNATDQEQPAGNGTETPTSNATNATTAGGAKKTKTVLVKETLDMTVNILDIQPLDAERFKSTLAKLKVLDEQDKKRTLTAKARNTLETFVIDMQNKMYADEYEKATTEEERTKITSVCSEISDWLYEDGQHAEKENYEDKFKSLKLLTKDLEDRVREHKDRPDALDALEKMLNISMGFLESSKSLPEDEQMFTEVEITTLEKLVQETFAWRLKKLEDQGKTALNVAPVLTVRQIAEKIDALDREVKYMVNKARVNKLNKQRTEEKERAKAESDANKTADETPSEQPEGEQQQENSEENKVDTGDDSTSQESTQQGGEGASADKQKEEPVTPTPSDAPSSEDSHTEL
ncbi:Hypoxia up-regulated protein 1 [Orchesella cincta]|uniref:Hypoxia up-regulated protein 1 n=1 Tax=Orchesella cincta TaxID=48709 RepID=A0A1D2NEX3_ORCCI|nr:Hypoxia up-regulated protein 1 [Orchesella cincta]